MLDYSRSDILGLLRCPVTEQSLAVADTSEEWIPVPRKGQGGPAQGGPQPLAVAHPAGRKMLMAEDHSAAYPVIDGIPVLLGPERLVRADQAKDFPPADLTEPIYAEAYEEMEYYNDPANMAAPGKIMGNLARNGDDPLPLPAAAAARFPHPAHLWVDAAHDSLTQLEAYAHLAPVTGKTVVQLGGRGSHAVKMLVAGARTGLLVTPMLSEARHALALAAAFGVEDRLLPVIAVGEQLPFAPGCIDRAYSGGCFHHMRFEQLGAELYRVLAPGGHFAGVDPYATALHRAGTAILGKREPSVHCRPVTPQRLEKIRKRFPEMATSFHGPVLRYFLIALDLLTRGRAAFGVPTMMRIMRFDDLMGLAARPLGLRGGSLAMLGTKPSSDRAS